MANHERESKGTLTITEIAALAGVSIATVSRVLNDHPNVKAQNVAKVEKILAEHGIQRSAAPRRSRAQHRTIGLIVPDLGNPWFPSLIKGVENISRLHKAHLLLSDSENRSDIEAENIETMVEREVDGLILVPSSKESPAAAELVDRGFPVVFLDRRIENRDVSFVTSTNRQGAYQVTKYLLTLGHRQIVYVAGSERIDTEWKRRQGFLYALSELSLEPQERLIIKGEYNQEEARQALAELIETGIQFTAVFASDDVMAYGAVQALEEAGLHVPSDVSVVGFDDIPFSSMMSLTTVAQSPFELGKNAVFLLEDILEGRVTEPKTIELPTSMVIRDSCERLLKSGAAGSPL